MRYNYDKPLSDSQLKRKVKQFKTTISKDCIAVEEENGYKIYEYSNGQKFICRGYLSDSAVINFKTEIKTKKLF